MDKRYQVFLSSTFSDLEDERKEVMSALQKAGYFVAGMELFPSDSDESWEVIKRFIDQSDYYVLVIAGRYGSIGKGGKSFTEMEYDYAMKLGVPILAFLHADPENLPGKKIEQENTEKLGKFIQKINKTHTRCTWDSKHGLATEVLASISQTVNLKPRTGWVRGDVAQKYRDATNRLEELQSNYERIRQERDSLQEIIKHSEDSQFTNNLAWGDDTVNLDFSAKHQDRSISAPVSHTCEVSWTKLFDLLGPSLIGWKSSGSVSKTLSTLTDGVESPKDYHAFWPSEASLERIRNQFIALRLLELREIRSDSPSLVFGGQIIEQWKLSQAGLFEYACRNSQPRDEH